MYYYPYTKELVMSNQKTKVIPFDTIATEVKHGVWEWEINGTRWRWVREVASRGPNCGIVVAGEFVERAWVNTIDQAGCFSQGYEMAISLRKGTRWP
jgi:hypothetical protein